MVGIELSNLMVLDTLLIQTIAKAVDCMIITLVQCKLAITTNMGSVEQIWVAE